MGAVTDAARAVRHAFQSSGAGSVVRAEALDGRDMLTRFNGEDVCFDTRLER